MLNALRTCWLTRALLAALVGIAPANATYAATPAPVGPGMSPVVTFDPDRGMISRPPTKRALTAKELKLARERAQGVWDAFKVAPAFNQPGERTTYLTSWAVIDPNGTTLRQSFTAYWSDPRDTRQHKDGAYYGAMGGAHSLLYLWTNEAPSPGHVSDGKTRGDFGRTGREAGKEVFYFAQPRVLGELAGGTVYQDMIVFTRDRKPIFAPVPLGALLDIEIARMSKWVVDQELVSGDSLRQLEASMTPEAVIQRRAKRQAAWARETRDPVAMSKRLDAAHRTDEWDYQRQRERLGVPSLRDPKSTYWAPRMLLESLQAHAASLDPAARKAPACARLDSTYGTSSAFSVRYEALATADSNCVPMVKVRDGLVDPKRPHTDVQVLSVFFRENLCGEGWSDPAYYRADHACARFNSTLKDVNWPALFKAIDW